MDTEGTDAGPGAGPDPAVPGALLGAEAGPDAEAARRRMPWSARIAIAVVFLVVAGVIAGFFVRVPYTTIAPGEALSLPSRVTVHGATAYPGSRGDIRLLFVREAYNVNFWQYVRARLDSEIDIAPDAAINPNHLTPSEQNSQALQEMADAKNAATAVALKAVGYKVASTPIVVVTTIFNDLPAAKVLKLGDVLVSADGHAITDQKDLTAVIAKHRVGEDVALVIERSGTRMTVHVGVGQDQGRNVIGVGIQQSARFKFPVKVSVDTTGIGGPSAGLAMTLAIFDELTPGNLTGGKRVAVTGTIDPEGNVGEIGGIEQKAIAARAAGVKLFIVPQCSPADPPPDLASCKADLGRAEHRAGKNIKVIPVSTFTQALDALREAGGDPAPTSTTSVPKTPTTIAA